MGGVGIIPNLSLATLHDLHLHLTLRYLGGWGWVGGVGIIPNLSLATLHDLHLHLMLRYTKFAAEGHAQTKIMQISTFSTPKNYKNAGVFVFRRQIWRKNLAQFADDEVAYLLLLLTRITIKSVKNIQKHCKNPSTTKRGLLVVKCMTQMLRHALLKAC